MEGGGEAHGVAVQSDVHRLFAVLLGQVFGDPVNPGDGDQLRVQFLAEDARALVAAHTGQRAPAQER